MTCRLSTMLGDDFGGNPHATLQHMDDYVAANERRLVNLQAARSGATIPDDPDLEIEITAARAELSTPRREHDDLRARYAAAVPDAVGAALADIRDMGPEGNAAVVFGPDTDPDAERAVRGNDGATYSVQITGRDGRPVIGSHRAAALVDLHQGETIALSPTGPMATVAGNDEASVLALTCRQP
ncbi:hypothetical protein ACWGO4_36475 [Streptomyces sp. NPDC055752]